MNVLNKISVDELIENFSVLDDWESRYAYLIDLGKRLPSLPDSLKIQENCVKGCMSQVWMVSEIKDNIFTLKADSDAHIVRGLVAILIVIYNGRTLDEAKKVDIDKIFSALDLSEHLSTNRRNGFYAMVEQIKVMIAQA